MQMNKKSVLLWVLSCLFFIGSAVAVTSMATKSKAVALAEEIASDETDPQNTEETTAKAKVTGASLTLGEKLNMNFYFTVEDGSYDGIYAVFSIQNGTQRTVTTVKESAENGYYFVYEGLTADRMQDTISMTIYDAEGNEIGNNADARIDSVTDYLYGLYDSTDYDSFPLSMKVLISDVLHYGAAAEEYANETGLNTTHNGESDNYIGKESGSVNYDYSFAFDEDSVKLTASDLALNGEKSEEIVWKTVGLTLDNGINIVYTFTATDTENLILTVDGQEIVYTQIGDDQYKAVFPVGATKITQSFEAVFTRDGTQVGQSFTYGVKAYVSNHYNDGDGKLATLVKTLWNYGLSTAAYASNEDYEVTLNKTPDVDNAGEVTFSIGDTVYYTYKLPSLNTKDYTMTGVDFSSQTAVAGSTATFTLKATDAEKYSLPTVSRLADEGIVYYNGFKTVYQIAGGEYSNLSYDDGCVTFDDNNSGITIYNVDGIIKGSGTPSWLASEAVGENGRIGAFIFDLGENSITLKSLDLTNIQVKSGTVNVNGTLNLDNLVVTGGTLNITHDAWGIYAGSSNDHHIYFLGGNVNFLKSGDLGFASMNSSGDGSTAWVFGGATVTCQNGDYAIYRQGGNSREYFVDGGTYKWQKTDDNDNFLSCNNGMVSNWGMDENAYQEYDFSQIYKKNGIIDFVKVAEKDI
jgi:hypothetical protein